jgi:shikimate kinase
MKKRIALIGFMGSGKTTLGKSVSEYLGLSFVDLDNEIEKYIGMPIPSIFSKYGEAYFRVLERETLMRSIGSSQAEIFSTGGGTPCFYDNFSLLQNNFTTIWLDLPYHLIAKRLYDSATARPLVNAKDLKMLFDQRVSIYKQADHIISEQHTEWEKMNLIRSFLANE